MGSRSGSRTTRNHPGHGSCCVYLSGRPHRHVGHLTEDTGRTGETPSKSTKDGIKIRVRSLECHGDCEGPGGETGHWFRPNRDVRAPW